MNPPVLRVLGGTLVLGSYVGAVGKSSPVGAAAAYCLNTARFVDEIPGTVLIAVYPAAVGVHTGAPGTAAAPCGLYCALPKKNNLFFRIGPPILPPKRLSSKRGFPVNLLFLYT